MRRKITIFVIIASLTMLTAGFTGVVYAGQASAYVQNTQNSQAFAEDSAIEKLNATTFYPGKLIDIPKDYTLVNSTLIAHAVLNGTQVSLAEVLVRYSDLTISSYVLLAEGENSNYDYEMGMILIPGESNDSGYYEKAETDIYVKGLNRSVEVAYATLLGFQFRDKLNLVSYLTMFSSTVLNLSRSYLQNGIVKYEPFLETALQLIDTEKMFVVSNAITFNEKIMSLAVGTLKFVQPDQDIVYASVNDSASIYDVTSYFLIYYAGIDGTFDTMVDLYSGSVYYTFDGNMAVTIFGSVGVFLPLDIADITLTNEVGLVSVSRSFGVGYGDVIFSMYGSGGWDVFIGTYSNQPSQSPVQVALQASENSVDYEQRNLPTYTGF